ncbi:DUF3025 domain-containing protein [Alteromonas sp. 1_MG-2023]|uniref:DUF3025 domain-containing protein n=1 Tax=Alteromonas sp. 1_MG-2023 TaxID=3062669 RepID=UPI0026E3100C|nr:DUF3025 domain-containing protein [Alteromonas sp. 1_MG-2023]MDO6567099.1 DUF3025 domain-containing protein [Alteromonas sp. 1_MG-2023]
MPIPVTPWCKHHIQSHASSPVHTLLTELRLLDEAEFPTAARLNRLREVFQSQWQGPVFIAQGELFNSDKSAEKSSYENDTRYYEEIIAEDNCVPTRENSWHDLFNALIWIQFPATKALLNKLHMQDIAQYGAHPRTERRNRITHFDECGLVLALEAGDEDKSNQLLHALAQHHWVDSFVTHRHEWGAHITPFIFGHANLEMMLSPFIGLTGKWLAVSVPKGFSEMSYWQQRAEVDKALVNRIAKLDAFNKSPLLKPIPLLGVPNWFNKQDTAFYNNSEYFRPLRQGAKPSIQLPLHDCSSDKERHKGTA